MHTNKYSSYIIGAHWTGEFVESNHRKEIAYFWTCFIAVARFFTKDINKQLIAAEERHLEKEDKDCNEYRVIEDKFNINCGAKRLVEECIDK